MKITWLFKRRPEPAPSLLVQFQALAAPSLIALLRPLGSPEKSPPNQLRQIDFCSPLGHIRGQSLADFGTAGQLLTLKRTRRKRS